MAPLVHAYNSTKHDSTGYSPFFFMFCRHPRLAVDACLGLNSPDEPISSRTHYATKLKKRLAFAYKAASRESNKSGQRNDSNYDLKVRNSVLDIGDCALIRKVGFRGKHKLAERWDRDSYVVIGMPEINIHVYHVQKEFGDGSVKTLHRNMLLPFSAIPSISEIGTNSSRSKSKKEKNEMSPKTIPVPASPSESDFVSDSNESPVLFVPRYVPPHRRNNVSMNSKTSSNNDSADGSTYFINDSSHHGSLNTIRGSPSVNVDRSQSNVGTESSFQAALANQVL